MAFSMLLRTPACTSRIFSQHIMKFATHPSLAQTSALRVLPKNLVATESKTPLLNSVRQFRTTMIRRSEEKPHDHAKLWIIERATSAVLVPLIPLALLMPNKIFDSVLAILVTAHSFWGLEAIVVDYVRASIFGPFIPKLTVGLVYLLSIATLGGLFYLISHDIGIANVFRRLWAVKSSSEQNA